METNRTDSPKFSEKYQNMLSIKLFWLVFCLFRFNRNIESLCFCIEPKQPKQTVLKQTKTNRNNCKFSEKKTKICPLSHCLVALLFFRFNRNTENLWYGTEPKQPKQTLYRLHTAILDRPPSSAATMEVQGPDTQ